MTLCELCKLYYLHGDQGKVKCPEFKSDKEKPYFDKTDHAERSKFHQPQHIKHWKKEKEKPE